MLSTEELIWEYLAGNPSNDEDQLNAYWYSVIVDRMEEEGE
jgi:hypothetical protein